MNWENEYRTILDERNDLEVTVNSLKEQILELESENARLRELAKWPSIETAPRDGRRFIAWDGEIAAIGIYSKYYGNFVYESLARIRRPGHYKPTHWRLFPPFPNDEVLEIDAMAVVEENARLRSMAEWRPISEAPRDGTQIEIAYRGEVLKRNVFYAIVESRQINTKNRQWKVSFDPDYLVEEKNILGFRLLPPPPEK